eukprot:TRINITY_DN62696_c0_g1_i1.p1 TRINITY_DN62696_c0_g1~~TRINITY_DN62696_c0_g1_i1.p1  ORF type:complete len:315 (+),score=46.01 TRINITY_DN62696_c0_g1_i1:69-947(+)
MVDLKVSTCRFGNPPDPQTEPFYPGVSRAAFDPSGALAAYRAAMKKERDGNTVGQRLRVKVDSVRGIPPSMVGRLGDIMPGHRNLKKMYGRLGYTYDVAGNPKPPVYTLGDESEVKCQASGENVMLSRVSSEVGVASTLSDVGTVRRRGKATIAAEAHSRLSLLEGWHEQMKAANTLPTKHRCERSVSVPNIGALWPESDDPRSRRRGADETSSCISAAPAPSVPPSDGESPSAAGKRRATGHGPESSMLSFSKMGQGFQSSPLKATWTWSGQNYQRGPTLLPPGRDALGAT